MYIVQCPNHNFQVDILLDQLTRQFPMRVPPTQPAVEGPRQGFYQLKCFQIKLRFLCVISNFQAREWRGLCCREPGSWWECEKWTRGQQHGGSKQQHRGWEGGRGEEGERARAAAATREEDENWAVMGESLEVLIVTFLTDATKAEEVIVLGSIPHRNMTKANSMWWELGLLPSAPSFCESDLCHLPSNWQTLVYLSEK